MSFSKIVIMGNLTADPEQRYQPDQQGQTGSSEPSRGEQEGRTEYGCDFTPHEFRILNWLSVCYEEEWCAVVLIAIYPCFNGTKLTKPWQIHKKMLRQSAEFVAERILSGL